MFIPIDTLTWERREHFEYYRTMIKCGYSCTINLDITKFIAQLKNKHLKFYPSFIYCVSNIVNNTKEFRMAIDQDGHPGYFDILHPSFTIFHDDTKTFSDMWTEYYQDFGAFYSNIEINLAKYKDVHGIKARDDQPPNFFCISCVPWLSYTAYNTYIPGGEPNLFPIITFGKYIEYNGRYEMPFTLNISHAAADGYHSAKFFNDVQELIDTIKL